MERWIQELTKVDTTEEMQAIADYYAKEAKKIVEPKKEDLLAAAKNYVVARRIMAAEKCQGISVDCFPLLNERRIACGPCLAWSKLLDEGMVGGCEGDADAAVSLLLAGSLLGPARLHAGSRAQHAPQHPDRLALHLRRPGWTASISRTSRSSSAARPNRPAAWRFRSSGAGPGDHHHEVPGPGHDRAGHGTRGG